MTTEAPNRFFLGGIPRSITNDDLRTHFSKFGQTIECRVQTNNAKQSLGYGWVSFTNPMPDLLKQDHYIREQKLNIEVAKGNSHNLHSTKNNNSNSNNGASQGSMMGGGAQQQSLTMMHPHALAAAGGYSSLSSPVPLGHPSSFAPPPQQHMPHSGSGVVASSGGRRRRSRSRSYSNSSRSYSRSDSEDSAYRSRRRRRRSTSHGRHGGSSRPVVLPQSHTAVLGTPTSLPPPPPQPSITHSTDSSGASAAGTVTMVCLPYQLCPPEIVRDPRACIGQYLPTQQIVQITSPPLALPTANSAIIGSNSSGNSPAPPSGAGMGPTGYGQPQRGGPMGLALGFGGRMTGRN